jgi:hypothetical protein
MLPLANTVVRYINLSINHGIERINTVPEQRRDAMVEETIEVDGKTVQVTLEDGEASAEIVDAAKQLMIDLNDLEYINAREAFTGASFPPGREKPECPDPEYTASAVSLDAEQHEEVIRLLDTRDRKAEDIDIQRIEPNVKDDGLYIAWRRRE